MRGEGVNEEREREPLDAKHDTGTSLLWWQWLALSVCLSD